MVKWQGVQAGLCLSFAGFLLAGCAVDTEERAASLRAVGTVPCHLGDERVSCHTREPVEGLTLAGLQKAYGAEPWLKFDGKERPELGLALMGGGAQAGAFSLGVLKRMVDSGALQDIDVISVVSGGGYAALYLYNNADALIAPGTAGEGAAAALRDNFVMPYSYCIGPKNTKTQKAAHMPVYSSDELARRGGFDHIRYGEACQAVANCKIVDGETVTGADISNVQCRSDIFSGDYTRASRNEVGFDYRLVGWELTKALATAPAYWATNLVFDTGLEVSPSKWRYRNGIMRTYGACPANSLALQPGEEAGMRNCMAPTDPKSARQSLYGLHFAHLKRLADESDRARRMPVLVLNATIPTRPVWDMRRSDITRMDEHRFEINPFSFGNHQYGFLQASPDEIGMAVGDGVGAAAAFADPAQRVFGPATNLAGEVFANLLNAEWSVSIPNYRMSPAQRVAVAAIPTPFHLLSRLNAPERRAHIHLGDGGISRDTFGILSLLERGTRTIFVSDHVDDLDIDSGELRFETLCNVANFLAARGYRLIFEGHPTIPVPKAGEQDPLIDIALHCDGVERRLKSGPGGKGYSHRDWQRFLWKGTIRKAGAGQGMPSVNTGLLDGTNIYLMKTAIPNHRGILTNIQACINSVTPLLKKGPGVTQRDVAQVCPLLDMTEVARRIRAGEEPSFPPLIAAWLMEGGTQPEGTSLRDTIFPQDSMFTMTAFNSQNIFAVYLELGNYLAYHMAEQIRLSREQAGTDTLAYSQAAQ